MLAAVPASPCAQGSPKRTFARRAGANRRRPLMLDPSARSNPRSRSKHDPTKLLIGQILICFAIVLAGVLGIREPWGMSKIRPVALS